MIATAKRVLDQYGKPISKPKKLRAELHEAFVKSEAAKKRNGIAAKYDAAGSSDEFDRYWANADAFDADSANSRNVRLPLIYRSRYEIQNNGYAAGIAGTWANDLVGLGPTLRMQTNSEGFNRMVETAWYYWQKEVGFRRKLWCLAHAKDVDGEGFAVIRKNNKLRSKVKLDLVLHEAEQCSTPYLPWGVQGYIDGIKFDQFSNPEWYDFLERHPGSSNGPAGFGYKAERVPAKFVCHWFKMIRPGQHRGIPASVSTLNLGASGRRWREAVVSAAEQIADFALFLETPYEPDEADLPASMSTMEINRRMMTTLPDGVKAFQPKAEQPTSTHEMFTKSLINEQARPKSMPLNKAMCNSSDYNYASGRLDHSTYYGALDVDRGECDDLVLDPLFDVWFEYAVLAFGWLGGNPSAISDAAKAHVWDWPKHQVADIKSEAAANDTKLKNGSTTLSAVYSDAGQDYEDDLLKSATANGVTVDQQRQINLLLNLPQHVIPHVATMLGLTSETSSEPMTDPQPAEQT